MAEVPVITVDGPSGTGKGTVCSILATSLGWHLLDSGSLYRVLALSAISAGVGFDDEVSLEGLVTSMALSFETSGKGLPVRIFLNKQDVSEDIRTESCGNAASLVAALPGVRQALLQRQRAFKQAPGLVDDGRDMGTIVFPSAKLKIFLTASPEERASRRYKQLKEKGISVNLRDLSADIVERDRRDKERAASPLKPADDAVIIDTTDIQIEQVMSQISVLVEQRFGRRANFSH